MIASEFSTGTKLAHISLIRAHRQTNARYALAIFHSYLLFSEVGRWAKFVTY
jgi:hypothetical protein